MKLIHRATQLAAVAVLIGACARHDAGSSDTAAIRRARSDSSSGEVAQYALMQNAIGWLTDSNLVSLATTVNQAPITMARAESEAGSNDMMRSFAVQVIRDHAALQLSIDSLAARRRIPSQRPAVADEMQKTYDSLLTPTAQLPAAEREAKFLEAIVALHAQTVTDFGALAGNAADPDLRILLASRAVQMEDKHVGQAKLFAAALVKADSARQAAAKPPKKP